MPPSSFYRRVIEESESRAAGIRSRVSENAGLGRPIRCRNVEWHFWESQGSKINENSTSYEVFCTKKSQRSITTKELSLTNFKNPRSKWCKISTYHKFFELTIRKSHLFYEISLKKLKNTTEISSLFLEEKSHGDYILEEFHISLAFISGEKLVVEIITHYIYSSV